MVAAVLFFNLVKLLHEDREASAPYFQKKPSPVMYMADMRGIRYHKTQVVAMVSVPVHQRCNSNTTGSAQLSAQRSAAQHSSAQLSSAQDSGGRVLIRLTVHHSAVRISHNTLVSLMEVIHNLRTILQTLLSHERSCRRRRLPEVCAAGSRQQAAGSRQQMEQTECDQIRRSRKHHVSRHSVQASDHVSTTVAGRHISTN